MSEKTIKWNHTEKIATMDIKFTPENHAEDQYLRIMRDILDNGIKKDDRTGTGTLSTFGQTIKHDFKHGFPLLTSKKIYTRAVIHELLWFLKGTPDGTYLKENKVRIWDEWMKKGTWVETEDSPIGPRKSVKFSENLLPHTYGVKWRDFDGTDQIANAIEMIKNNPNSRRIIVSAWDPRHVKDAALPWCHDSFQFLVEEDRLNLWWRQRSCDWFLGVPFNIASYAFLLLMVCEVTGYKPGKLWGTFGDAHLYLNHLEQAKQQLANAEEKLYDLPVVRFKREIDNIDDFKYEDFSIEGYKSWPSIKAKVSV